MRSRLKTALIQAAQLDWKPVRVESYIIPWLAIGSLRTELIMNNFGDSPRSERIRRVDLTQYDQEGRVVGTSQHDVGRVAQVRVALGAMRNPSYGYCVLRDVDSHQHLQIWNHDSFAITHGRSGALFMYGTAPRLNLLYRRLRLPVRKRANVPIHDESGMSFLLLNLSDLPALLKARLLPAGRRLFLGRIAPFGALLSDPSTAPLCVGRHFEGTVEFMANVAFDFYVLASHGIGEGRTFSIQHVK